MQDNWLNKIRNHQTPPPPGAWQNITNELDKENENTAEDLKTKILAYEATPPADALHNIFNQLDQAEELTAPPFIDKIKSHTQAPPAAAWQNIVGELDKDENVIPLYQKKKKAVRFYLSIAVAAAAAIVIVWITVISNNKKVTADNVVKTTPKKTDHQLPAAVIDTVNPPIILPQKNNIATNPVQKVIPVKPLQTIVPGYIKNNNVQDLAQSPGLDKKEKLQNTQGETPVDIALLNTPNTYLSMIGADGQSVKVSSKFSNLIGAFSNDAETKERIDIIIDESAKWRPIIEQWKNKMTNNAVAPSLSNFMDIIALSEILEEKK